MFEGFANVWTPVVIASRLRRVPLALQLAGERIVLFRDGRGGLGALIDRCPHRGVRLSLGSITKSGCLACPFHGWEFGTDGTNRHVPLNPDARRERLGAVALPVREIGGLIWIYTAPGSAPCELRVPPTLTDPTLTRSYLQVEWRAHWTRAMENMLDSPHVPILHRRTIGRFVRSYIERDSRMDIEWEETPWGGRTRALVDGSETTGAWLEFHRPNVMVLHIPAPGRIFRLHAICIPLHARGTRLIVVGARNFARLRLLNPIFNWSNMRVVREDQPVVESSDPPEVPHPSQERSVRTDRATLQFRRYYHEVLARSSVGGMTATPLQRLERV